MNLLEWNGRMEWWSGLLEWSTGLDYWRGVAYTNHIGHDRSSPIKPDGSDSEDHNQAYRDYTYNYYSACNPKQYYLPQIDG